MSKNRRVVLASLTREDVAKEAAEANAQMLAARKVARATRVLAAVHSTGLANVAAIEAARTGEGYVPSPEAQARAARWAAEQEARVVQSREQRAALEAAAQAKAEARTKAQSALLASLHH